MKRKIKIAVVALAVITITGFTSYNYVMHGGARDLTTEKTDFTVTSKSILEEFTTNTEVSNKKYLEKAVAIKGVITAINKNEIILDKTIICGDVSQDVALKIGQNVTIKGRVVGFDDLMGDLKLDQSFIVNN
jgi:hypothetical protein